MIDCDIIPDMVSDNVVDVGQVVSSSFVDWTLIVLSVAVTVSLIFGISNIVLTKNIEAKKYKYEVLKEICDWLESVIRCGGEVNLKFMKTPIITPNAEKEIAEEAIAQYFLISSRINFISNIASLAGISSSSFKQIEDGIIGVMEALDTQLANKKIDIVLLYKEHVKPLNESCSDLMGEIALALGKEVKLRPNKTLIKLEKSNNS